MKRIISIITVISLTLALTACGSENAEQPTPTVQPTQTEQPTTTEQPAPTAQPTTTEQPTQTEQPTLTVQPTQTEQPEQLVDFKSEALSYYSESSTELLNKVMTIYPVNDTMAIFQFSCYDATDDVDMPVEAVYPFTFMRGEDGKYIHTEKDQSGATVSITATVDDAGDVSIASDFVFPYDITGRYLAGDDAAEIAPSTLVEYLRNVPGAEIDDFGLYNPYDETEETLISGWFHDLTLMREGEIIGRFLIADDLSVVCQLEKSSDDSDMSDVDDLNCRVLAGSFENTLNHEETYEVYNEDEDDFEEFTQFIVYPYVTGGTVMTAGAMERIEVSSPWELTEAVECSSSDESIVAVADGSVMAKAPGEVTLNVTLNYGGAVKEYELTVQVAEADDEALNTVVEYSESSEQ